MSAPVRRRLERLERTLTPVLGKVHVRFGTSDEEIEQQISALKASTEWSDGDSVVAVRFVSPGEAGRGSHE